MSIIKRTYLILIKKIINFNQLIVFNSQKIKKTYLINNLNNLIFKIKIKAPFKKVNLDYMEVQIIQKMII
jgi:hypothetical protein